jgi:hypothetical protein
VRLTISKPSSGKVLCRGYVELGCAQWLSRRRLKIDEPGVDPFDAASPWPSGYAPAKAPRCRAAEDFHLPPGTWPRSLNGFDRSLPRLFLGPADDLGIRFPRRRAATSETPAGDERAGQASWTSELDKRAGQGQLDLDTLGSVFSFPRDNRGDSLALF